MQKQTKTKQMNVWRREQKLEPNVYRTKPRRPMLKGFFMSYTTKISAIAAVAAIALTGTQALAANAITGSASATIAAPISISETTGLSFGSITAGATAGTVAVAPAGGATYTGVSNFGGGTSAAPLNVAGAANTAYSVTVDTTASLSDGVNSMSLTGIETNLAGGSGTLSATGTAVVNVRATLNVAANQAAGAYTGTYNITVNYEKRPLMLARATHLISL